MYHQHSQQQGTPPFSSGLRPPLHQQPPNQHQSRPPSNMLSPVMGFPFPRPTQLPDELESALAIRGARDVDHRHIDHMNQPNQHQNQGSASGISQHGSFSSNPMTLSSDNQSGHQPGVDWSSYQPPTKLFAGPPPSASHQSQRQLGPQQQPQSSLAGTSIPSWTAPVSDSPSPQARHPNAGGSGGSGDGHALYTPESAGSILASFGLSNEDLEVLSHYPDDQLTPDTLPFILRDIQINKSGNQKTVASTSSLSFSRSVHDMPLPPSRSPEVPSLLTVTQTAGKVIDYGHASRAKAETGTRETFKRERLSNERTVKMFPSSSAPKLEKVARPQVRLEHDDSSKHGDRDYRRTSGDHRKRTRSPGREFPRSSKSRNLDRDYRRDAPKPRPPSEDKSEASSRRSLSSSSGSRPRVSSKKLPTPTMISDFSAVSPKVYPHTCSLCHAQCDQEKEWVDHVNTVNHTAACRDLRNKYPGWKPYLPSRSGPFGSRAPWDPKTHSPSHSVSRSLSGSRSPSPPPGKRVAPRPHRANKGPFSPHNQARLEYHKECLPPRGVKRPHEGFNKFSPGAGQHPPSSKAGYSSKHGPLQTSTKTGKNGTKTGTKTTKSSAKVPPAKRKKKMVPPASQDLFVANRLVYLTGIPKDASEQDVTNLVGSFGKINNVILMACSEEERQTGEGQKASVCMVKAECALTLASSTNLSIRGQQITASIAKKTEAGPSLDTTDSKPAPAQDNRDAEEDSGNKTKICESATPGNKIIVEADQKTCDESMVLISGLPASGWTESDILQLVQTFGTPLDVITATQIGKVLVSVADMEIAQEMVKVNAFRPAKIEDSELKMTYLRLRVGLNTPVALYNLLMGSLDPLESSAAVGWSCLLVISNVPTTPSGPAEVQKLVRRFGTVMKTLELNNMVICEMATAAMALSVYKRFQKFPCIIHNNPLFFSRKPDPKGTIQTKVIPASLEPAEGLPAAGKGSQAAAADKETTRTENSEPPLEGIGTDGDSKDAKLHSTDEVVGEDQALEANRSQDEDMQKDMLTVAASDSLATPQTQAEADLETHLRERSDVETVLETVEENKGVDNQTAAGEETKTCSSEGGAAPQEAAMPELPKVTQEMVNALLVECRTRTVGPAAPTNGGQGGTPTETEQSNKATEETKVLGKDHTEHHLKKELKEKGTRKEKQARDRERREKERRDCEKERTRREREHKEKARREERRARKRAYSEARSGSRSFSCSEEHKQSSWSDGQHNNTEAEAEMVDEEFDGFPFNLSDFVTVDEVGDVNDLPSSIFPSVPMETGEGGEDAPTSVQQKTPGVTPMEVSTETSVSDVPAALVTGDVTSDVYESGETPASPTSAPTCPPEAPETTPPIVEPAASAEASSNSPEVVVASQRENGDNPLSHNHTTMEDTAFDKTEEEEKKQDQHTVDNGTHEQCELQASSTQEAVHKKFPTAHSLPPFDPSSPVGLEYLVPKTGFFCKVCNRFFTGAKEAERNHCKTLKHYENLQKYLKTTDLADVSVKPDST